MSQKASDLDGLFFINDLRKETGLEIWYIECKKAVIEK
jgi:hypothetical protein